MKLLFSTITWPAKPEETMPDLNELLPSITIFLIVTSNNPIFPSKLTAMFSDFSPNTVNPSIVMLFIP